MRSLRAAAHALLVTLGIALAAGCGAGDPDDSSPDGGVAPERDAAPAPGDADAAPTQSADAAPLPTPDAGDYSTEALVGTYAIRTAVSSIDDTPAGEQHTTATSFGVAVIEQSGDDLELTERWCRMTMDNDGLLAMSVTDETVRAIPSTTVELELTGPASSPTIYRPPRAIGLGVELDDPETDPLPTDADDPRVVDLEDDGHPGMSVHFSGFVSGTVYAVRRQRYDYTLSQQPDGRLVGRTVDTGEQSIVGASDALFDVDTESSQNPDLSLSPVTMIPLEDEPDCDAFVDRIDELFPE